MSLKLSRALKLLLMLGACLVAILAIPGTAQARTWDGVNPHGTPCEADAITARDTYISGSRGSLELRYSPSCRTVWTRLTIIARPASLTEFDGGDAWVETSDHFTVYRCSTAMIHSGTAQCYTPMINDAGITSYAGGEYFHNALLSYHAVDWLGYTGAF